MRTAVSSRKTHCGGTRREGGSLVDISIFWLADALQLLQQQSIDTAVQFQVQVMTAISRTLTRRIRRAGSGSDQWRTQGESLSPRGGRPVPKEKVNEKRRRLFTKGSLKGKNLRLRCYRVEAPHHRDVYRSPMPFLFSNGKPDIW